MKHAGPAPEYIYLEMHDAQGARIMFVSVEPDISFDACLSDLHGRQIGAMLLVDRQRGRTWRWEPHAYVEITSCALPPAPPTATHYRRLLDEQTRNIHKTITEREEVRAKLAIVEKERDALRAELDAIQKATRRDITAGDLRITIEVETASKRHIDRVFVEATSLYYVADPIAHVTKAIRDTSKKVAERAIVEMRRS